LSNWHRMIWIDRQIREKRYPNCAQISERFNISIRQASRDVEYLRDSLEAPVKYCYLKKGYHYTDPVFQLPAVMITESQKKALSILSQEFNKIQGSDEFGLGDLFDKLERVSDERNGQARSLSWRANMEITEMKELVATTVSKSDMVAPCVHKTEPFFADVKFETSTVVELFRLDAVHSGNSVYRIRYYSVEAFILLLLSIPYEFRILSPNWLKNILCHRLEKKLHGFRE